MDNIIIDLMSSQPDGNTKFHGGGEYIKTVFYYLINKKNKEDKFWVCLNKEEYIDEWILEIIHSNNIHVQNTKCVDDIVSFLYSFKEEPKVYFFAGLIYSYRSASFPSNVRTVGTCHGLRAIEKPNDKYQLKYLDIKHDNFKTIFHELSQVFFEKILKKRHDWTYSSSIQNFDVIITVSNHSLYSIKINYPEAIRDKEIHVLYPMTQRISSAENISVDSDEKYIMLVSANRWIKNSYRACMAIDELYTRGLIKDIKTKVFGNLPRRIKNKINNIDRFEFFDYVTIEELEKAYAGCTMLFYPTLNEGFGAVPLEALKYGKTCVVSAICSLPEVYGNSVVFCNPYDVMEMQNRIMQAIENPIDKENIEKRLQELYCRQLKDVDALYNIIKGKDI